MLGGQKRWKERRRPQPDVPPRELVEFSFDLNGHHIGKCEATRVYFENGRRVAEIRAHACPDLNALTVRLMRAFFNIEVRT